MLNMVKHNFGKRWTQERGSTMKVKPGLMPLRLSTLKLPSAGILHGHVQVAASRLIGSIAKSPAPTQVLLQKQTEAVSTVIDFMVATAAGHVLKCSSEGNRKPNL